MLKTKQKTLIHQTELEYISRCIHDYPNLEIGGDLFGFYTTTGLPVVQLATGPGPKAKQTVHSFYQDEAYLIEVGNCLRERFGMQHLGEWHSHHQLGLDSPSEKDDFVVNKAMDKYNLPSFLLVIGTYVKENTKVNGFRYFSSHSLNAQPEFSKWIVLEEPSPFRKLIENEQWISLYQPKTNECKIHDLQTTTLEATEELTYPIEYWLCEDDNKVLLNDVINQLTSEYPKVQLLRTDCGEVYLEIVSEEENIFQINFPADFPRSEPIVSFYLGEGDYVVYDPEKNWDINQPFLPQILAYINAGIKELKDN